ncbi:ABC transporter ATP-binding protein [Herbiconiux sp. A18JL235]|uniref:ABC transporter ATP-binding protein n=1 Tax=Herbiconiux sp. A18JL235 TaxID=3152363 RepID=A0AB39BCE6_9MICO
MSDSPAALEVDDLRITFHGERGDVDAVRGVSFSLAQGESLALLGESGSGKTVTGRALLGLVDRPGQVTGSILYNGEQIVGRSEEQLRAVRGVGLSMVFQDSLDSLNPVFSVGSQLTEILRVRRGASRREAREEALRLMESVGIPDAASRIDDYPHQFSGGMRQRICIAMAIALKPKVLIADEPTTALDVTVQAGILRLLRRLQREHDMSVIFVTHDLAVARLVADSVLVMYRGEIVERGVLEEVFERPRHPYTKALLAAHPARAARWQDLRSLEDGVASVDDGRDDPLITPVMGETILEQGAVNDYRR